MLQLVRYMFFIMAGFMACSCNHLEIKGLFVSTSEGVQSRFEQSVENDTQRNVINTLITANPAIFAKTLDEVDSRYGSLQK